MASVGHKITTQLCNDSGEVEEGSVNKNFT